MAELEPQILGVGHGDPITKDASDRLHELADSVQPEHL